MLEVGPGSPKNFAFGQPVGGIVQFAYTVADIDQAMKDYGQRLGAGPWFVLGPFTAPEGRYRGAPSPINVTLAIGYSGHMQIELVQQNNDVPSVFREFIAKRGHGFHHWAIGSRSFEADIARYQAMGYEVAFSDRSPRGVRVVYMDTTAHLPGMVEIIELTEGLEARYAQMQAASVGWDGRDPVRRGL